MKAFVVRPRFDEATRITSEWGNKVLPLLRKAGLDVIDLVGNNANRGQVEHELRNDFGHKGLFLFYDHGLGDRLFQRVNSKAGEQVLKWVIDTQNVYLLAGKIVVATCCLAGRALREACIAQGGLGFLGYREEFHFIRPVRDHFGGCVNSGVVALLDGQDIYQAEQTMRAKFLEYERYYYNGPGKSRYPLLSYTIAEAFRHNKENLVALSQRREPVCL